MQPLDSQISLMQPDHTPAAATNPRTSIEIRLENLYKSFDANHVLRGVNLEIHTTELVAIVGGTGCGKTVMLDHMIGQFIPDRGRVLVTDHHLPGTPLVDMAKLDDDAMDRIRMHRAVVFQRNALFTGTVFDNIALWLREMKQLDDSEIEPIAREALTAVGFHEVDAVLARDRDDLSGGMAKRVAIARALAMNPMILLYDEPTTGLDPTHAQQIHELIRTTHQRPRPGGRQQTTIIITHDKDLLYRLEPRIIMLADGVVHFDGTYEQFEESDSPIIRPYFDLMPGLQEREVLD